MAVPISFTDTLRGRPQALRSPHPSRLLERQLLLALRQQPRTGFETVGALANVAANQFSIQQQRKQEETRRGGVASTLRDAVAALRGTPDITNALAPELADIVPGAELSPGGGFQTVTPGDPGGVDAMIDVLVKNLDLAPLGAQLGLSEALRGRDRLVDIPGSELGLEDGLFQRDPLGKLTEVVAATKPETPSAFKKKIDVIEKHLDRKLTEDEILGMGGAGGDPDSELSDFGKRATDLEGFLDRDLTKNELLKVFNIADEKPPASTLDKKIDTLETRLERKMTNKEIEILGGLRSRDEADDPGFIELMRKIDAADRITKTVLSDISFTTNAVNDPVRDPENSAAITAVVLEQFDAGVTDIKAIEKKVRAGFITKQGKYIPEGRRIQQGNVIYEVRSGSLVPVGPAGQ